MAIGNGPQGLPVEVVGGSLSGGDGALETGGNLEALAAAVDDDEKIGVKVYNAENEAVTYDDLIETKVVKVDITVDTAAYADNDSIGGLKTLTDFARVDGGSGVLSGFQLRTKLNMTVGGITVHIFDANPTASTFTDNAAMVIHADDETKLLRSITVAASGDWVAPQGQNPWYTYELVDPSAGRKMIDYQLAADRDLYFAVEANGAVDFTAAGDFKAIISAQNN